MSEEEYDGPVIVKVCTMEDYLPTVEKAKECEENGELRNAWLHYGTAYDIVAAEFSKILETLESKIDEIENKIAKQRPDGKFLFGFCKPVRYCCEDLKNAVESEEFGIDFEDGEYVVIVTPAENDGIEFHHECPFCGKKLDQI